MAVFMTERTKLFQTLAYYIVSTIKKEGFGGIQSNQKTRLRVYLSTVFSVLSGTSCPLSATARSS